MEKTEDIVTALMWIMVFLGVILDLLICKYRALTKIIIYFELISFAKIGETTRVLFVSQNGGPWPT